VVKTQVPVAVAPAPPARRWPWVLFALAVLTVIAMLLLRWLLQPERLGALLVERAARATGLEIDVAQPARLGVWPVLQLELIGLEARLPRRPALLVATRVDIALPLAMLWGAELQIGALALRSPRLDLVEWRRWRGDDLAVGPPLPPALPDRAAALTISDGMLLAEGWQIARIRLDASPLRDGQPFSATGGATLLLPASAHSVQFEFDATPVETDHEIELRQFSARLGGEAAAGAVSLEGEATVGTGLLQLRLVGLLQGDWPPSWPALPTWGQSHVAGRALRIDYDGGIDFDGRLHLRDEAPSTFAIGGNPRRLLDWNSTSDASPLPPLTANVQLDRVEIDGAVIEGLNIQLEPMPAVSND
jgi:hypothetical protein